MGAKEYDYLPPGQRYAAPHSTAFTDKTLSEMKAMVVHADPDRIRSTGQAWSTVHSDLVGGSDGGVLGMLDALVTRLRQHWEGDAAEAFGREAERFRRKIAHAAEHARYTSIALRGAANALQEYKAYVDALNGDDAPLAGLAQFQAGPLGPVNAEGLLNGNRESLSAAQERQLEAAVVMEQLGAAYNSQGTAMASRCDGMGSAGCPDSPGGNVPVEDVLPIPYSVSLPSGRPQDRGPDWALPREPRVRTAAVDGVIGGVRSRVHTVPADRRGGACVTTPGVAGGVVHEVRGGDRSPPQHGVVGAEG
jgi:uncharacterized protein YukE